MALTNRLSNANGLIPIEWRLAAVKEEVDAITSHRRDVTAKASGQQTKATEPTPKNREN